MQPCISQSAPGQSPEGLSIFLQSMAFACSVNVANKIIRPTASIKLCETTRMDICHIYNIKLTSMWFYLAFHAESDPVRQNHTVNQFLPINLYNGNNQEHFYLSLYLSILIFYSNKPNRKSILCCHTARF